MTIIITLTIIATAIAFLIGRLLPNFGPEHIEREGQNLCERTWGDVFNHHDKPDGTNGDRNHG